MVQQLSREARAVLHLVHRFLELMEAFHDFNLAFAVQRFQFPDGPLLALLDDADDRFVSLLDGVTGHVVLLLQLEQRRLQLGVLRITIIDFVARLLKQLLHLCPHVLLRLADDLVAVLGALVVHDQALVADRSFTAVAKVLQVFGRVDAAVERLVDGHRLGVGLQHNHLMLLEAPHRSVSVVAAGAKEVGTVVASRNRLLLALARRAHERADVDGGKVQDVRQDEVEGQR